MKNPHSFKSLKISVDHDMSVGQIKSTVSIEGCDRAFLEIDVDFDQPEKMLRLEVLCYESMMEAVDREPVCNSLHLIAEILGFIAHQADDTY